MELVGLLVKIKNLKENGFGIYLGIKDRCMGGVFMIGVMGRLMKGIFSWG